MSTGYSGTPLGKKLGIKPGALALIINAPDYYFGLFPDWPNDVTIVKNPSEETLNFIHVFCPDLDTLFKEYHPLKSFMRKDGMMWISWPKKSSGISTDIKDGLIREYILDNGLVDVKKAAIDETWSGLKAMYRLKDR